MKRLLFVLCIMIFLTSCGLDSSAQDGLTNAVGLSGNEETDVLVNNELIAANVLDFQCSGIFVPGRTYARINFRLTTDNEALGGDTAVLYGAGLMQLGENKLTLAEAQGFSCQGNGQLRAYQTSDTGSAALADWLLEQNFASLTAQIDGVMTPLTDVIVTGLAVWPGQEPAILPNNENLVELRAFQCEGNMIPNSSQAAITFTAEADDSQKFAGGGILETGIQPTASGSVAGFECSMDGVGQITRLDAVQLDATNPVTYSIMFETFKSGPTDDSTPLLNITIPMLRLRSNDGQEQQIMFETFMTAVAITN